MDDQQSKAEGTGLNESVNCGDHVGIKALPSSRVRKFMKQKANGRPEVYQNFELLSSNPVVFLKLNILGSPGTKVKLEYPDCKVRGDKDSIISFVDTSADLKANDKEKNTDRPRFNSKCSLYQFVSGGMPADTRIVYASPRSADYDNGTSSICQLAVDGRRQESSRSKMFSVLVHEVRGSSVTHTRHAGVSVLVHEVRGSSVTHTRRRRRRIYAARRCRRHER